MSHRPSQPDCGNDGGLYRSNENGRARGLWAKTRACR
jgi:hypothetical protein